MVGVSPSEPACLHITVVATFITLVAASSTGGAIRPVHILQSRSKR
uniref:Uncharacterized protein n=1 Tax=Anguilla anguilla TaxID=7936 RepID=A0A0E9SNH0_ANGAN